MRPTAEDVGSGDEHLYHFGGLRLRFLSGREGAATRRERRGAEGRIKAETHTMSSIFVGLRGEAYGFV